MPRPWVTHHHWEYGARPSTMPGCLCRYPKDHYEVEHQKVVLAYSGGLDTSIILRWLEQEYGCEVVTFTADLGQGENWRRRAKAEAMGFWKSTLRT